MKQLPQQHALILARLLVLACLVGGRAPAQTATTNEQPPAVISVAKPDSEANTWAARAVQALRAGEPDAAMPWIQRLLQADPAALASTNDVTFRPARQVALELIRAIPERTRAAYRAQLDLAKGAGKRLPATTDPAALEERYQDAFASDRAETGFRLAGLHLDQGRFSEARGVLKDLLDSDAIAKARRPELLARLVVACARVGDFAEAERAWAELQTEDNANRWPGLKAEVSAGAALAPISNAWTMAYGGPSREGAAAPAVPDIGTNGAWILRWGLNVGPGLVRDGTTDKGPTNLPPQLSLSRAYAAACMTERNQRPSDDLIFGGNRAWINGFGECVAVDLDAGRAVQRTAHRPSDPPPNFLVTYGTWVFGNRLNRSASLLGNRAYCIEDNYRSSIGRDARERLESVNGRDEVRPLPCGNVLAAYAADTGRLLWRIGRELPPQKPDPARRGWRANAIRFAAAPVACGALLLAPVEDNAGLCVVGLDPESGAVVWRTRLDECIPTWAPRASTVSLTMDGATAYLCNGRGSLCALDGSDGSARWTALYESLADLSATNPVIQTVDDASEALSVPVAGGRAPAKPEATWEESLVLVAGETVVALPEDSDQILAYARRSGARLWVQRKPEGVDYVVGKRGASLIVAGGRAVACVDLADGRERWRTPIEVSTGRGTLCGQEVLIPKGQTILRLRVENGALLGSVRAQTMDNVPLGNLYVNGNQLLVAGLERLYALVDGRPAFDRLRERLAKEPTAEAYMERSRLYAGIGRYPEALADLREAWKRQRGSAEEESARAQLLAEMDSPAAREPGAAEALYAAAAQTSERAAAIWRLAQYRERIGNTNGALALYTTICAAPDVAIPPAAPDIGNWEVSVRRLAAQRIRALLENDSANGWKRQEEPAAQALARLGSTPSCAALVELAMFFPGTAAGQEAALKAAQLATDRGDLGTAEAILRRALLLLPPPARITVAERLVRLYETMKWPEGVSRLRDEWPRVCAGTPVPEFLERAVAARRAAAAPPPPPWRLRWRGTLEGDVVKLTPAGIVSWERRLERTERYVSADIPPKAGPIACLNPDAGVRRWQRDILLSDQVMRTARKRKRWDDVRLLLFPGETSVCVDMWSGAATTNRVPRIDVEAGGTEFPAVSRIGLATTTSGLWGGTLVNLDVLTGQIAWRRDADTLMEPGTRLQLDSSSPAGAYLANYGISPAPLAALDPWTGAIASRRSVDASVIKAIGWRPELEFDAMEQGAPTLENQRLTVKNLQTGATLWTSPPDLAIVKHQVMPNGAVLVQTEAEELLLFGGKDGKILSRSGNVRFAFSSVRPSEGSDAVIAFLQVGPGTNDVLVLDPAVKGIAFQCRMPPWTNPVLSLGPTMPNQLLVSITSQSTVGNRPVQQSWVQVINERGENPNGWRLPLVEDLRDASAQYYYTPYFVGGLILMVGGQGEVLAYEHDPVGEKK
jgi:tetratricopeptide (TPR) repeat protein/outer membrane protein assembly factor BamB